MRRARDDAAQDGVAALAIEAQPIDHTHIARQPKDTWARISELWLRGHRTDLHEPEAKLEKGVGYLAMLVESRRHSDRIGEIEPEGAHGQPRIVRNQLYEWRKSQRMNDKPMRVLGIEHPQHRSQERFDEPDHGASSGKLCR